MKIHAAGNAPLGHVPKKFFNKLLEIPALYDITPLPNGSLFHPTIYSPLRYGDLLVYHAESCKDINTLVENRKSVEQFLLILILGDDAYRNGGNYYLLNPRFVMTSHQNITDLKAVIGKMADRRYKNAMTNISTLQQVTL